MPRRYKMGARAVAAAETRQRIAEAAKKLQVEQGISGTSYEEIAERAGVAQATVYRHFPTLDDLIPVCARSIQVLRPVTADLAAELFHGIERPTLRMAVLIRGTCQCYEHESGWLHAARREGDFVPALQDVVRVQQDNLRALVRVALDGMDASERSMRVIAALIDFPFWKSLRDTGLDAAGATEEILELVGDQLAREAIE